jgi:hypothetical protein
MIDPNDFPMVMRNDALLLHRKNVGRQGFMITADIFAVYSMAVFTRGEQKVWAKLLEASPNPGQDPIVNRLIKRQPALRLSLLLDDLIRILHPAGAEVNLNRREGAISLLDWVEEGCPADWLPLPPILEPELQASFDIVMAGYGRQFCRLRRRRFGWVVPPQSRGRDYSDDMGEGVAREFPRIWLSEAQLEKYRADADWSEILEYPSLRN